jgi:mannan polymerase complexes MNN9 subunit
MAVSRSLRRSNPITLVLAFALLVGVIFFLFSGSNEASSYPSPRRKVDNTASNPLSPPTAPFRKQPAKANGQRTPPPVVYYHLNNLTATANPIENQERVLILTPLARFYQGYWDNLQRLSFPHDLISIGFIIPKNREGNAAYAELEKEVAKTQTGPEKKRFASVNFLRQDFDPPIASQDESERHKMSNQKLRRAGMSVARNSQLFTLLGPHTSWVLWLDADIVETPPSLIQDLAGHNKPIIVPNCYQRYYNDEKKKMDIRPYDFNSWQDSETAQNLAASMGPEDILLEGYAQMATYRTLMAHIADTADNRNQRMIIQLDGVGGTALLVKAEVHRDGAMFPPFPFYHLMETEGFAKMARRLGWESFGLPNYFVCPDLSSPPFSLFQQPRFTVSSLPLSYANVTLYIGVPLQRVKVSAFGVLQQLIPERIEFQRLRCILQSVGDRRSGNGENWRTD